MWSPSPPWVPPARVPGAKPPKPSPPTPPAAGTPTPAPRSFPSAPEPIRRALSFSPEPHPCTHSDRSFPRSGIGVKALTTDIGQAVVRPCQDRCEFSMPDTPLPCPAAEPGGKRFAPPPMGHRRNVRRAAPALSQTARGGAPGAAANPAQMHGLPPFPREAQCFRSETNTRERPPPRELGRAWGFKLRCGSACGAGPGGPRPHWRGSRWSPVQGWQPQSHRRSRQCRKRGSAGQA